MTCDNDSSPAEPTQVMASFGDRSFDDMGRYESTDVVQKFGIGTEIICDTVVGPHSD